MSAIFPTTPPSPQHSWSAILIPELHSSQYRLRLNEWRVFYDVASGEVQIRGVVRKADASEWLAQFGEPS